MKAKFLSAAILFVFAGVLSAFAYNSGPYKVISSDDGGPVEYACIANKAGTFSLMTDSLGGFTLPGELNGSDSITVFRIGYVAKQFSISGLPETIYLEESPKSLTDVVVVPRKKKTLGGVVVPNKFELSLLKLRDKTNPKWRSRYLFNKEGARKFKIKNDFILRKIRVAISNEAPLDFVFIIYRKIDREWVAVHTEPIVAKVAEAHEKPYVVELEVGDSLEPQPKGEYMVSIMAGEQLSIWSKMHWFEDGYHRNPLDDNWETNESVPGIELQIEY